MKTTDHNGTGEWSGTSIQERYAAHREALGMSPLPLASREYIQGDQQWIYPLLETVINGIEPGDPACVALGVELIESDQHMPFGKSLKSTAARALRRSPLSEDQKQRLRKRIVGMLMAGMIPHEFREYSKLLRVIGVAEYWPELHARVPRENRYAMRFYRTLLENDPAQRAVTHPQELPL